ncbi:hypothetical protein ACGFXC_33545 [Streptomyces sp. NPDC048507]|uniref:hypothetical protein n=1 Tax=Streptomyces sp. NPDC048507 TaxID=3365560 RepID=UPI0037107546
MPEIRSLLSPIGETVGETVDWESVSRAYGTAFPSDFREFIEQVGGGSIEDQLVVLAPCPDEHPQNSVSRFNRPVIVEADRNDGWSSPQLAQRYPLAKMLIWGDTVGADTLCWFAEDPDPDAWPVAVFSRASLMWSVHHCGMSGFLAQVLSGDLLDSPLSDESLLGWGEARFLNFRDEKALYESGVDPWECDE